MINLVYIFVGILIILLTCGALIAAECKPFAHFIIYVLRIYTTDKHCSTCGLPLVISRIVYKYTSDTGSPVYHDKTECVFGHIFETSFSNKYIITNNKRKPYTE